MSLSFVLALRNARAQAIKDQLGAAAKLKFYNGAPPANAEAALGGGNNLLATIVLPSPIGADPTTGALVFTMPQEANAVLTGTASFFRVTTSADVVKAQGSVAEGSGGDINLVETDIVSGLPLRITSLTWTEP